MKQIKKKLIAALLAVAMTMTSAVPALAEPQSIGLGDLTDNVSQQDAEAESSAASSFLVTIPETVTLTEAADSGSGTYTAEFTDTVTGDIGEGEIITVLPDTDISMTSPASENTATASVTLGDTEFDRDAVLAETTATHSVSAELTPGDWTGTMGVQISMEQEENQDSVTLPVYATVTFTAPSSTSENVEIDYPTGFTIENSHLLSYDFYSADNVHACQSSNMLDIQFRATKIRVYAKDSSAFGKSVTAMLFRQSQALVPQLLWTNPSPTANFVAQTVSIDLSQYSSVYVKLKITASGTALLPNQHADMNDTIMVYAMIANNTPLARPVTIQETGVIFGNCTTVVTDGARNDCFIPYEIYGIK